MRTRSPLTHATLTAVLLGGLGLAQSPAFAADVFYNGRATGFQAVLNIAGASKKLLLAKNDMSCEGLPKDETVSGIDNRPPIGLKARTITTFTQGVDGVATASAAVEDLTLEVPGLTLRAAVLDAFAEVRCVNGKQQSSGHSNVGTVVINGETFNIGAEPNQTIEIPDVAKIVFNEQVQFKREFKVKAIHITLFEPDAPANGDIFISEAKARILSCGPVCTAP